MKLCVLTYSIPSLINIICLSTSLFALNCPYFPHKHTFLPLQAKNAFMSLLQAVSRYYFMIRHKKYTLWLLCGYCLATLWLDLQNNYQFNKKHIFFWLLVGYCLATLWFLSFYSHNTGTFALLL